MKEQNLTTWEAACIITGYGIGAGALSMPYMAEKNGLPAALLILTAALFASYVLHLMIADLSLKCEEGGQIIACLERFLFRGRWKRFLTLLFFVLMALIFCTNLAAYISGAEQVMTGLWHISGMAAKLAFYVVAASVVFLGLKAVGVSEKLAVTVIFVLIGVLAVASVGAEHRSIPLGGATLRTGLAYFGLAMFSMSAFFSVPQAAEGLEGDRKKIRKAVFLGLFNTYIIVLVITVCALWSSKEVTEVVMVGWSAGIGVWAQVIGGLFTLMAMLTTYWSLSLALGDILKEMLHLDRRLCWLLATAPSLVLVLLDITGFMDLMRTAGGLIAIIVAVMVVPAWYHADKEVPGSLVKGGGILGVVVIAAYVLMAIGSVVPV